MLRATDYAEPLDAYFVRVEELTGANRTDSTTVFVDALTILLRDGVEALLSCSRWSRSSAKWSVHRRYTTRTQARSRPWPPAL